MYGFIARQYLDVQFGRLRRETWQTRIIGVEVFEGYRNPAWDFAYDEVRIGNATELLPALGSFDLAVMADVIEHFPRLDAERLVRDVMEQCRTVIISTPAVFVPQGPSHGNVYETHHFLFTASHLPRDAHFATLPAGDCNIYVASFQPIRRRVFPPLLYESLSFPRKLAWRLKRFVGSTDI